MDAHHVDEADMLDHAAPTCNAVAIFRVGDVGRAANPYPALPLDIALACALSLVGVGARPFL